MLKRFFIPAAAILLMCCLFAGQPALGAVPAAVLATDSGAKSGETVVPSDATPEQIRDIMAGMSDEQVRRLLLDELKKSAATETVPSPPTGIPGIIASLKADSAYVHERFQYLFSGASAAPQELPVVFDKLLQGDRHMSAGQLLIALAVLTSLWLGGMYVFKKRTARSRKAIADIPVEAPWYNHMGRLFLRAMLDLFGVVLVGGVAFACYFLLFHSDSTTKIVIIAWLMAMVFLAVVKIGARFLLAPHAPNLRYLPLTDGAAQTLFTWTVHIARVLAVGMLVNTILWLQGSGEAVNLMVASFFGFLVAFILMLLILWNKQPVADAIRNASRPGKLLYQFADSWHAAAIAYVLLSWVMWVFAIILFGTEARFIIIKTLLLVPGYLLVDWATQRLVAFASEMAGPSEDGDEDGVRKYQTFLSTGFRLLVMAATVFVFLRIWGVDIQFGRAAVKAALSIMLTLVLAYIFWVFISNYIESRLKDDQGDEDHGEGDGGGPGGDRFSTLLQLVRKFIFAAIAVVTVLVILSSLGVDIGPLIAGASVFGIAIGFGAQTLVKDIISGIFFLMDDAFRVGDYIIVGSARGTVEEISVRSFKLRHHLGPLYTIPFGSIHQIENMTRDWAVMKLQYLVPFDTDIQKVKKIIKKINKEVRAIPELDEMMLGDIKSQGVKAMEEYGMRMRVKFMTKPGGQFTLRKLVLAKMRKQFEEAGIEFAKPRVSVHIPDAGNMTDEDRAQVAAAASKAVEEKKPGKAPKNDR